MNIELGAGSSDRDGYITVDHNPAVDPDIVHDLRDTPLPFDKDTADIVRADHVLEHLPREQFIDVLYDIHRILTDDGTAIITGPHYLNHNAPAGNHFRGFSETTLDFLTPGHDHGGPDLFTIDQLTYRFRQNRRSINLLRHFLGDIYVAKHIPNTVEELQFILTPVK